MGRTIISVLILLILPLALLTGAIFRYSLISFIYAFLLLVLPWLGPLTNNNIRKRFRLFILIIGLISFLAVLAQIIFQSVVLANKSYNDILNNCTEAAEIFRYFGLETLNHSTALRIVRLIFPDIIILAVSIISFVLIRRTLLTIVRRQDDDPLPSIAISPSLPSSTSSSNLKSIWPRLFSILKQIRFFLQFLLIGIAAFLYPSLLNSIYFLFFLTLAFVWSLSIKFEKHYAYGRAILVVYTGIHLLIIYLYQFGFFQDSQKGLPPKSLWSNITGLSAIIESNCSDKEPYFERDLVWTDYLNPCALLVLYFYFAFETNRTFFKRTHSSQSNETTIHSIEQQRLVQNAENRDVNEQNSRRLDRRWSLEQPGDETWSGRIIFVVFSIIRVLERHSYLLSLISMLAWSITYHSLLTLVYLLWACLLWVLPNSRQWCLKMSPLFSIYGGILLILQYFAGFKISFQEYHFAYGNSTMEQIGIKINDFQPAFNSLAIKSFYLMFFLVTFRQYINEKQTINLQENEAIELRAFACSMAKSFAFLARQISTSNNSYPRRLGLWLINLLTKYWIFVSCGSLLLVSIQNTVVIYRIIYMVFYLFFILSFQISFGFWRRTAATFHLTIIIYSMIVLIGIYIYQFKTVHEFLRAQNVSAVLLESIGLAVVEPDVLALKLLAPSTFLVVNILQLYYFHSDWIKLITMPSDKNIQGEPTGTLTEIVAYAKENTKHVNNEITQRILESEPKTWLGYFHKQYLRLNRLYKYIIYYGWRFSEIHCSKFILFLMVLLSILKICAFNIALIILATIGLTCSRLRKLVNLLTLITTGLFILSSMSYQLAIAKEHIVEQNVFIRNCSQNSTFIPNDTVKWFGLELTPDIDRYIGFYIFLTIILTFDAITQYRQRHRCLTLSIHFNVHLVENRYPILFEPIALKNVNDDTYEYQMTTYEQADTGVWEFLKYLTNFLFYRFGLEICYITTVIVVGIRLDIIAVFYCIWLGLFLISSRRSVQRIWPFYILFLTIFFPLQYFCAVGAPPFLCFEYPWTDNNQVEGWKQLKRWLFLPDYLSGPSTQQLIADFFQFLFACRQWRVFKYETKDKDRIYAEIGGSNREIIYDDNVYKDNRTWDFVINKRHWLDHIKYAIFMYGAWIVLSIVYLAGITRISLLGLGYLIACFYFFWYGQDFLTKNIVIMLKLWGYLIYYCFSVIFVKACLQVAVCIFLHQSIPCQSIPYNDNKSTRSSFCTFVDLLVPCLKDEFLAPRKDCSNQISTAEEICGRSTMESSLFMDGFCMTFLLIQKRIFGSFYWEHIVAELVSQAKLASQGAKLFNDITQKRMEEDHQREEATVDKINQNLKRIKEHIQGQQTNVNRMGVTQAAAFDPNAEHFQAIRSGDYYMFEYESDQHEDEEKQDESTRAQEEILHVLTSSDHEVAAAVAARRTASSPVLDSDDQETPIEIVPPMTTTEIIIVPPSEEVEEDPSKHQKQQTKWKSILMKMLLIGRIVVDYFINIFNRNSRDYRDVSSQLADMKSREKISQQEERIRQQTTAIDPNSSDELVQQEPIVRTRTLSQSVDLKEHSRFYRLFDSLFYFTMSRSELLCYSAMVINHLTSGALLSMPLPLSIFFWAMLSSRPSKNYWITVITYTEAMIVIKYIFQFQFYPWNQETPTNDNPLFAVNIIGINKKENGASIADLFLLLSLFLHRSILKQLGLWKEESTADNEEPTDEHTSAIEPSESRTSAHVLESVRKFCRQRPQTSFVRDVYALTFFCDFINMIIVIGFYDQFGLTKNYRERASGNVVQTIKENKVPVAFLVILLIQFILLIIDRALYLRHNVVGKLFFQIFQVIGIHVWLFFVLPGITHIKFRNNVAAQFWYLFKCIYFGYSSTQVRFGYPKRIAGNFLMKRFNYVNQILYRIYLLIPFLLELRTIMDWIFTDTALGLSSWLQLEDIYSNVYLLKCARWAENKYPTKRAESRPKITKYGLGGTILGVLILLIWFPLLFFSFSSSFYQANPPKEVTVEVKLGGYLPIYQMTAQDIDLKQFTDDDLKSLRSIIDGGAATTTARDSALAFLRDFNAEDICCVNFFATSVDLWQISQPIRDIVVHNLRNTDISVPIRFSYTITRNPPSDDNSGDTAAVVAGEHTIDITKNHSARNALVEILINQTNRTFIIPKLFPRFLHVKPKAQPDEIDSFRTIFIDDYYANVTMNLNHSKQVNNIKSIPNSTDVWWELSEYGNNYTFNPRNCSLSGDQYLTMIFFNDKVSPANISFLTRYGIIGLYTTFVIVVARLLRTVLQTSRMIIFYELPSVERLWHLLRDIYLVRENAYLDTEEQLFAKLLFLYRSPETLIRFTKPKSQ